MRTPHALILGLGHAAGEDESLGPAADGAEMGPHAQVVRPGRNLFVAQHCYSGFDVPKRLGHR